MIFVDTGPLVALIHEDAVGDLIRYLTLLPSLSVTERTISFFSSIAIV